MAAGAPLVMRGCDVLVFRAESSSDVRSITSLPDFPGAAATADGGMAGERLAADACRGFILPAGTEVLVARGRGGGGYAVADFGASVCKTFLEASVAFA